ncbi:cell division protein FtsQ/DivIB [Thermoactinomyces sp. CICC 10523]|uniref:cell division protein FtsQ/DivIB n=1 Tax=Thermoactinomyces sp. CICC 10523 TaxID=2767428 RepID=UPI0018DBE775|nr:FtsQ-type POTRA domain-containing protein [Thermoactinomyces sp. CICC 10523]MBH8598065.1 FtsQ-type POTRA domain-containing protein [Thermoactinomyces sp. CICC 10523]
MVERVPPFRSRVGKKRSPAPWMFAFIFLFFTGMFIVLFLRSPLSKIERIDIVGNHLVSSGEILHKAKISKGISYFGVNREHIEKSLETMPEIKNATVTTTFPNQIYIQVQEKTPVAMFRSSDQELFPILSDGTILLNRTASVEASVPVFEGWKPSNSTLRQAVLQLAKLPGSIRRECETVRPVSGQADQVEIDSKRKHRIFVRVRNLSEMMLYYPSFYKHPSGTLFLLESVWFIPDHKAKEGA